MTPPMNLTLRAVSSGSVEVNWTQPVSVPPQYRVSNHSITCTSSHGVYTTTHLSASVKESTHIHMIISALMSNTSYTCCVSAHSELGTSESVCDTVNTTGMHDMLYTKCKFCYTKQSHIENGMSDILNYKTNRCMVLQVYIVPSCTVDNILYMYIFYRYVYIFMFLHVIVEISCIILKEQAHPNTTSRPSSASQNDGIPWVGGVIIGAVLSTVIFLTVLAAVFLLRRKKTHSQHKL